MCVCVTVCVCVTARVFSLEDVLNTTAQIAADSAQPPLIPGASPAELTASSPEAAELPGTKTCTLKCDDACRLGPLNLTRQTLTQTALNAGVDRMTQCFVQVFIVLGERA